MWLDGLPDHDATAAPAATLAAASLCVLIRGKHLNPDPRNTFLADAQHLGSLGGQVEDPAANIGAAVVHTNLDRSSRRQIRYAEDSAESQTSMGRGKPRRIKRLSACSCPALVLAPVPRSSPRLREG